MKNSHLNHRTAVVQHSFESIRALKLVARAASHALCKLRGDQTLVTGLLDPEAPYLGCGAVVGVRQALVTAYPFQHQAADMARLGLSQPYVSGQFNVALPPARA